MSMRDDGLAGSRQPPKDERAIEKLMKVFRKMFEPSDMVRNPTDTTAYRAPPRDDQIRFGT